MTTKHTPGPWVRRNIASARDIYIGAADDGGAPSVAIVPARVNRPADEADANARLIAAAPDLLAALLPFAGNWGFRDFNAVRAAIARATGEAA